VANSNLCAELRDLLEREHTALLSGQIDIIARLAGEKERLQSALVKLHDRAQLPGLASLRELALHNADLMRAVHRGIKAAQTRIAQIREGGPNLNTYDRRGQRCSLGAGLKTLERRA